ncbi:hypothetical protein E3E31_05830 [Thermococcus sp. M39]|uniref:hypothetical protein n=1 Tax=unclassified Thermococcus TaxID=2627626 RepID=UPI00143AB6C8|nr:MULTISPECIES: hypothetical protein [unclassified Thermococcus]NJE08046.1 hypothetical protein [Thermococcus sp. M39]NJE11539.1 hypothetical protein [Thermococcus sp. LS2]
MFRSRYRERAWWAMFVGLLFAFSGAYENFKPITIVGILFATFGVILLEYDRRVAHDSDKS